MKVTYLSILRLLVFLQTLIFSYHLQVIFVEFEAFSHKKNLYFLQPVKSITLDIGNFEGQFRKFTFLKYHLVTVLYTNGHISKSRSINLIVVSNQSLKCAPYNKTKHPFYPKCQLFPVLWECNAK